MTDSNSGSSSHSHSIPLGRQVDYPATYDASLLFPVPRQEKRDELGIDGQQLPFSGADEWTAYELSWLNSKGKPVVAMGRFTFACDTPNLVESKSLKLYCNSFNQTRFASIDQVRERMVHDLTACSGGSVDVELFLPDQFHQFSVEELSGDCLDDIDIDVEHYLLNAELLQDSIAEDKVAEQLYSHLLKSNCLITTQPDWASVWIEYQGKKIDREKLLSYLISFRSHNEFHEQCVERIYTDLMKYCRPEKLTVMARYTRRGGLDINPWRSSHRQSLPMVRLARQ